jgi:hypothetical protein
METEKTQKTKKEFNCKNCHFFCSKKSDWTRHVLTDKHIKHINGVLGNTGNTKNTVLDDSTEILSCKICKNIYKTRTGLWKHQKKNSNGECGTKQLLNNLVIDTSNNDNTIITTILKDNNELKNLILEVIKTNFEFQKENQELQKQMLDVCKNNQPTTIISNNNNNNNNKTFNLQVFLNEECKDAMNLKDFVNSFKLQLSDLELVGDEGFINGMTKVIMAKLDLMDANTRPFHCTDLKRETIYVKEDDVWVREGPDNAKLAAAIKAIGHQNFFILKEYKALHPDCESTYSEFNDHYMNLIMKSAGCQKEDIAKVIKKLVKEIVIIKQ